MRCYHDVEVLEELFDDLVEGVPLEVGYEGVGDVEDELEATAHHVAEVASLDGQLSQVSVKTERVIDWKIIDKCIISLPHLRSYLEQRKIFASLQNASTLTLNGK